jgi:transcriptional regulator with GAF, ATPase, and Fis domain
VNGLDGAVEENSEDFHGMIGRSAVMLALYEQVRQVARAGGSVLVCGESGVGKELITRALHAESDRGGGPLIPVNCAGIPSELLESELFGHASGAFTGAQHARRGLFAEAHGGTLLLDEIAELAPEMQAKLLRVLQDGQVRPLGANLERQVDVRVVAATNRDLEREVTRGRFREDLFYRLATFTLRVPPLRERGEDLQRLAAHFARHFSMAIGRSPLALSDAVLSLLSGYPFPGNVRELANLIERAVTFCAGEQILPEDLPEALHACGAGIPGVGVRDAPAAVAGAAMPTLRQMQLRYVRYVLDQVHGNKRRAAEVLGIGRRTLYRYLGE